MRIDAIKLLSEYEICHPTRFLRVLVENSEVRFDCMSFPWWQKKPDTRKLFPISFVFQDVVGGTIPLDEFVMETDDEDLETFSIRQLNEEEWSRGDHLSIYCSSPLSRPLEIYSTLHDHLLKINCPNRPEHYLNFGRSGTFYEFETITSSVSFLLMNGPESICRPIIDQLNSAQTKLDILRTESDREQLLIVNLNGSILLCKSAIAIIDSI